MLLSRSRSARNVGRPDSTIARSSGSSASATPMPGAVSVVTPAVYGRWISTRCYSRRAVRRIEIRLLDGPNLYRLEPAIKVEVALGRRRTWYGKREPERHQLVRLSAT